MDQAERRIMYGDPSAKPPEGIMCAHCGSALGPIELKHAEVLRLEEGDVVVLRFEQSLGERQRETIRDSWKQLFPANKVVVFDGAGNMSLNVLRQAALA